SIPFYFFVPVNDRRVNDLAIFIFFHDMLTNTGLAEVSVRNRIANPVDKLTIFIITDFSIVHIERTYSNTFFIVVIGVWYVLIIRTHHITTEMDIVHSVRIVLNPVFAWLYPNQFTSIATGAT